jgi:hypothetical protein
MIIVDMLLIANSKGGKLDSSSPSLKEARC